MTTPPAATTLKQIAIYGKGGIGKSTTSSNVAAAMARQGKRVMLVGCDPKQDSTMNLNHGEQLPSVLERMYEHGSKNLRIEDVCVEGPMGIVLVESGGPEPGVGCAGRGVITALQALDQLQVVKRFGIEVVIYDVLGDVVCGGFAMPLREGYAKEIYLVTSGELMALYAANNIAKAIERLASNGTQLGLGGLILNSRRVADEPRIVEEVAAQLGTRIVGHIPRDKLVQKAEARNSTVIMTDPDSPLARTYLDLASVMLDNRDLRVPRAMTRKQLLDIVGKAAIDEADGADEAGPTVAEPINADRYGGRAPAAAPAHAPPRAAERSNGALSPLVPWAPGLTSRAALPYGCDCDDEYAGAAP